MLAFDLVLDHFDVSEAGVSGQSDHHRFSFFRINGSGSIVRINWHFAYNWPPFILLIPCGNVQAEVPPWISEQQREFERLGLGVHVGRVFVGVVYAAVVDILQNVVIWIGCFVIRQEVIFFAKQFINFQKRDTKNTINKSLHTFNKY